MVWMQPQREREHREPSSQRKRGAPTLRPVTDIDNPLNARLSRPLDDAIDLPGELLVVEVRMGIDQADAGVRHFTVTLLARLRGLSGSFPRSNAAWYPSICAGRAFTSGAASPTSGVGRWTSKTGSFSGPLP